MQETIAVVFDFDDTLAPDSTSGFLESIGVDVPRFWSEDMAALIDDGWDPIPAYLYGMIRLADEGYEITRDSLAAWGQRLPLYEGVETVFDRLRAEARDAYEHAQVEFYMISSGVGEILRNTPIAHQFQEIWSSDFHYHPDGRICFPKRVVSFTDKTRYLFQASKGLFGSKASGKPFEVNKKVSAENLRIPFNQFIVVGDGYTDIPCFSMIRKQDGTAIAVYDRSDRAKWGRAWGFIEEGRVSNLVPASYAPDSALSDSLVMAVERKALDIASRTHTYQG